jgi:hypothetical protein
MNEMPSAEFRKTYAKLTDPTVVTVNGHRLGTWIPFGSASMAVDLPPGYREADPREEPVPFSSRPFTPAPKPSRR